MFEIYHFFYREILYSESNSINSIAKLPHIILSVFHVNLTGQGSRNRQMTPPPPLMNFAGMVLVYMCYVFGKQWVQKWILENTILQIHITFAHCELEPLDLKC